MSDTMLRSERNTARLGRKGHRHLCDVLTNHALRAREKRGWFKDQEAVTEDSSPDSDHQGQQHAEFVGEWQPWTP